MKIDAIQIHVAEQWSSPAVLYAEMSLNQASLTDSYIIEQGFGFDADEVLAQYHGSYEEDDFFNTTLEPRKLALKIRLNPQVGSGESSASLRDHLYKLIGASPTGLVEIRCMRDGVGVATIEGKITKVEADIFTDSPVVQMHFLCEFPLFRGLEYIELAGGAGVVVPAPYLIDNVSTAPHGFKMELQFTAPVPATFTIQGKQGTVERPFKIVRPSGDPFSTGDVLYFSSEVQTRQLYFIRAGVTKQLLDLLDVRPIWPMMYPGTNRISFSSSSVQINSLTYREHFWGI